MEKVHLRWKIVFPRHFIHHTSSHRSVETTSPITSSNWHVYTIYTFILSENKCTVDGCHHHTQLYCHFYFHHSPPPTPSTSTFHSIWQNTRHLLLTKSVKVHGATSATLNMDSKFSIARIRTVSKYTSDKSFTDLWVWRILAVSKLWIYVWLVLTNIHSVPFKRRRSMNYCTWCVGRIRFRK